MVVKEEEVILSIIVSVWNTEQYIQTSLNSIPKRKDIEVIIINDGSEDNSLNIINSWIANNINNFNNIILHTEKVNNGVSRSLNIGYRSAHGEFVFVLDSDDYLYTDNYSVIIDKLHNEFKDYDLIYIKDFKTNEAQERSSNYVTTWSYFLKKKIFTSNNLYFDEGIWQGSDVLLMHELEKLSLKRLDIYDYVIYHYNFPREGSLMWEYNSGNKRENKIYHIE